MVPTLAATLGVKGHRPTVGTRDCKGLLYVFAVVNLVTAAVHANTLESPKNAKKKTGLSKTRRMQEAFADHLRHVGRMYPRQKYPRVVLLIDNAPWHGANRSTRLWRRTRTWSSSGYRATARSSTRSNGSGRSSGGGRRTTACSTRWPI